MVDGVHAGLHERDAAALGLRRRWAAGTSGRGLVSSPISRRSRSSRGYIADALPPTTSPLVVETISTLSLLVLW